MINSRLIGVPSRRLSQIVANGIDAGRELRARETDSAGRRFVPHTGYWYCPNEKEKICLVCFAGALIARARTDGSGEESTPEDIEEPWRSECNALEAVRQGLWREAFEHAYGTQCPEGRERTARVLGAFFAQTVPVAPASRGFSGWDEFEHFVADIEQRILPAIERAEDTCAVE